MSILLTGASGSLGSYLLRLLVNEGVPVTAWSGARTGELFGVPLLPVDLADADAVRSALDEAAPSLVLHTAALASVADCHRDPERARAVNTEASRILAERCAATGARLVHVSTDLVFDGEHAPYREEDTTCPLSVYGRSKAEAEQAVLRHPGHVVVRVSLLFGPTLLERPKFFDEQVHALRAGRPVKLFEDEWRTPLDLESAAQGLWAIARSGHAGVVHLGGPERLSRLEMGRQMAEVLGVDPGLVVPSLRSQAPAAEPRARDVSLDSGTFRGWFPHLAGRGYREALIRLAGG